MTITICAVKNGELKITVPGVETSEFPHAGNVWFVSQGACAACGIDPKGSRLNTKEPTPATAHLYLRMGVNPCGVELVSESEYSGRRAAAAAEKRIAVAADEARMFPGIAEMRTLRSQARNEEDRARVDFGRMMDDENNDGVTPSRAEDRGFAQKLTALRLANPRARLYLQAEAQAQGTSSYSATSGEMTAGKNAMEILRTGGTIEAAQTALAFRYASTCD